MFTKSQCWKFPEVRQSEADNFQLWRRTGNFCLFFFNVMLMIWDSSHGDLQLFWLSFKYCQKHIFCGLPKRMFNTHWRSRFDTSQTVHQNKWFRNTWVSVLTIAPGISGFVPVVMWDSYPEGHEAKKHVLSYVHGTVIWTWIKCTSRNMFNFPKEIPPVSIWYIYGDCLHKKKNSFDIKMLYY